MNFKESLIQEWQGEIKQTRKILEQVPQDKLLWKPHEKSMTLGGLAYHIANLSAWAESIINQDEMVLDGEHQTEPKNVSEILSLFEKESKIVESLLSKATDAALDKPWSLKIKDKTIFTMPKGMVIRTAVFNHMIHHRGQLSVYLRLLSIPIPGMYGPSADEKGM